MRLVLWCRWLCERVLHELVVWVRNRQLDLAVGVDDWDAAGWPVHGHFHGRRAGDGELRLRRHAHVYHLHVLLWHVLWWHVLLLWHLALRRLRLDGEHVLHGLLWWRWRRL